MPIDLEALAEELGLEAYPAHPAKWSGRGKEAFLEAESSYRTPSPAPVRQGPATPGNQPLTGEVPGGAGDLPGEKPGIGLGDEDRHKPPRRSGLPGLPGGAGNPEVLFVNRSTPEGLGELLRFLLAQPFLGLDVETTGLDPHTAKPRLLSLAGEGFAVVVDLFRVPLEAFAPLFRGDGPLLVGHNLKFDLLFLLRAGVWRGSGLRLWDTGLAHQVLHFQARMPALKDLVHGLDKSLQTSDWSGPLSEEQVLYAAVDAFVPTLLYPGQRERAKALGLERVLEVEHRALPAVAWMELMGVPFDQVLWEEAAREAEER